MALRVFILLSAMLCSAFGQAAPERFTLCTFNLEAYLDRPALGRQAKSLPAQEKVVESLLTARADVLALEEMGSVPALLKLRSALRQVDLNYPYWEFVTGYDTNLHVAILSRYPIVQRRPHTNDFFILYGRRYRVSRGFAEVDIQINPNYRLTVLAAHLKSRRSVPYADQQELREHEARLLRRWVTRRLANNPDRNLAVLGDFNDTKDSSSLRLLRGRGKTRLIDPRPGERRARDTPDRSITWTYFYAKEDSYSRIDFILLSRGLSRELESTWIAQVPDWGLASDHRPVVASFSARDQ